ncbi:hypothetical protein, partial [Escherichia coli]|uniref:hypothetical protein n=1 Tax=Escherichia coli TaxID=562 RepID=UPI003CE55EB1
VDQQAVSIQKEKTQIQVQKQPDNPESKGAVNIAQSSNSIVVGFPLTVAEMDQKSTDRLGHVLDALTQSVGK